jgi:outer membrane protein
MFSKYAQTTTFILILLIQGCASPFSIETISKKDPVLNTSVSVGVKESKGEEVSTTIFLPTKEKTEVEKSLLHRFDELEELAPANNQAGWNSNTGINLYLQESTTVQVSIDEAITIAVKNNLDVQIALLQPQIAKEATTSARAAFDFVLGAGASKKKSRVPQQQIISPTGAPLNADESVTDLFLANASLTKKLSSGGTIIVSTNVTKTENQSAGFNYFPEPAWQTIGMVELNQPLLRNFGKKVTRAQIRISKLNENQSEEDVRASLNQTVSLTERAYLDLSLQWKKLQITQWLLLQGEQVVDILELRISYDTSEADYAQAVATVQQRKAEVIRQQAAVQIASDNLKQLLNSDQFPLDSEVIIQPVGELAAKTIVISLREALLTAVENRPDLKKLGLQIKTNEIQIKVADNARLPQLDMQAQMSFYGLGENVGGGYNEVYGSDYVNYLVGLNFQVPLGNRSAEADYQSTRLKKMSSVATYKRGIQQATIEVKKALRSIITNAALIQANKSFRIAQTENLRALVVEEETMGGLTPTFLNLKLQTQSGLASARTAELLSIIDYNKAITNLYEAMGTSLEQRQMSLEAQSE